MQGKKVSVVLLIVLIATAFALGSNFNQVGGWLGGGGGPGGSPVGPGAGGGPLRLTRLVVEVEKIRPADWNVSAITRPPPDSMFAPLGSLQLTLTLQATRPRPVILSTNSSGLATFLVSNGSYALHASDPTFDVDYFVNVTKGATTLLVLKIFPTFIPVDSYVLSGHDASLSVDPSSMLYAEVTSSLPSGPPMAIDHGQFVQLVEAINQTQVTDRNMLVGALYPEGTYRLNATALGTYRGEKGEWVALELSPPPYSIPPENLLIMTFSISYSVT